MAQDYDVSLKVLMRHFVRDYLWLAFGNAQAEIKPLDRELEATKLHVDGLAQVTIAGETFLFHAEFFSAYDKNVPQRMSGYAGRITDKYPGLGVYGVALYIYYDETDLGKSFPNAYETRIFGELRSYHKFEVIKVWELDADDILRQHLIGLLPIVTLMKYEAEKAEQVIRGAIQQMQEKVDDPWLRAEMFAAMFLFAGMKQLRTLVTKLLKEANMLELLKKSETYQDIFAEGRAEGHTLGHAEGHAEGRRDGLIYSLRSCLRARFGVVEFEDFLTQLQTFDEARLSELVDQAMTVESLEAFKKLLDELQAQSKNSGINNGKTV